MTLAEYLKAIADAIRFKKQSVLLINAQDFAAEIEAIEPPYDELEITMNGEYNVADYKQASVHIENIYEEQLKMLYEGNGRNGDMFIPDGVTVIKSNIPASIERLYIPASVTSYYANNVDFLGRAPVECYCARTFEDHFYNGLNNIYQFGQTVYFLDANGEYESTTFKDTLVIPDGVEDMSKYGSKIMGFQSKHVILPDSVKVLYLTMYFLEDLPSLDGIEKIQNLTVPATINTLFIPESVTNIYTMSGHANLIIRFVSETPPSGNDISHSNYKKMICPKGTLDAYKTRFVYAFNNNKLVEEMDLFVNVSADIINNESVTYSIDGAEPSVFTGHIGEENVGFITLTNNSGKTLNFGTTNGGTEIGSIADGGSITYTFDGDTAAYLTLS
jgi:hypothetical protein